MVMFRQLDTNKDGVVELDEVPERLARRARRWMNQGDANGDKQLSPQEFRGVFSPPGRPDNPRRDAKQPDAATGKGVAPQ
jgi:hypothetical protein